jgi:hypothetical protein
VAVERHDGGGAAVLGWDRPRSDGGGVVLRLFQKWKGEGRREAARAHKMRQWWRRPVGPGRKTTGWGGLAGPNPESGQNSREILFEFQLILKFGRTLKNCTRRFRRDFDMRIFSKIF